MRRGEGYTHVQDLEPPELGLESSRLSDLSFLLCRMEVVSALPMLHGVMEDQIRDTEKCF